MILNPYAFGSSGRTFTFIGSCNTGTASLDFSSLSAGTIAAGDLAVYIDFAFDGGGAPSAVTPSGFSNAISTSGGTSPGGRGMVSVKKLTGSEGSVTGMNADVEDKVGLVFRPSSAFTTITASGISSSITSSNPTAQVCDPSAETSAVILLGIAAMDDATVSFSTFSPAATGEVSRTDNDIVVGYSIFNNNPLSTTIDMADFGDLNWLASLYLTVS